MSRKHLIVALGLAFTLVLAGGAPGEAKGEPTAVEFVYTGELGELLAGGIDGAEGGEYRGNMDIFIRLDAASLGLGFGGEFFLHGQFGHGRGLTETHVGDIQTHSNIDAHDFHQLSAYGWSGPLLDGRLALRLGKQDANDSFCSLDGAAAFLQSSFGFVPTMPLPTFPDPALGAAAWLLPSPRWSAGVGLFDGDAHGDQSGWSTAFDGEGGAFAVAAVRARPGGEDGLALGLGAWRHTGEFSDLEDPAGEAGAAAGLYATMDWPLPGGSPLAGAFLQFGWSQPTRFRVDRYFGGGVTAAGLLPGRPGDLAGLGFASASLSAHLPAPLGGSTETVFELFYRLDLGGGLALQPDLQYVLNPGADGVDALVGLLRFTLAR